MIIDDSRDEVEPMMVPFYAVDTTDQSPLITHQHTRLMQPIKSNGRQKTSAMQLIDAVR